MPISLKKTVAIDCRGLTNSYQFAFGESVFNVLQREFPYAEIKYYDGAVPAREASGTGTAIEVRGGELMAKAKAMAPKGRAWNPNPNKR